MMEINLVVRCDNCLNEQRSKGVSISPGVGGVAKVARHFPEFANTVKSLGWKTGQGGKTFCPICQPK